jgi:hypothetical protein
MHDGVLCPVRAFNRSRCHTLDFGLAVSFERRNILRWFKLRPAQYQNSGRKAIHTPSFTYGRLIPFLTECLQTKYVYSNQTKFKFALKYNSVIEWCNSSGNYSQSLQHCYRKGKAVPLQAWSGPEGSRKLRFPDFMTTAQDGGKVVRLTYRPPLTPGNTNGTHLC